MVRKTVMKVIFDTITAALIILFLWIYNYRIPQAGIRQVDFQKYMAQQNLGGRQSMSRSTGEGGQSQGDFGQPRVDFSQSQGDSGQPQVDFSQSRGGSGQLPGKNRQTDNSSSPGLDSSQTDGLQRTKIKRDSQDWHQKFADKFTDTVQVTDTSYSSPNLSITLSYHQYDSGLLDMTSSGKHMRYGTKISYVLADIYLGDITCLQTAFAQDTYGIGYTEKLTDMSKRLNAVFAVNGDSYSNNRHQDNGTIIRNGVIYRNRPSGEETCVLNWDGTMDIYQPDELNTQTLVEKGAYQSWIFGPSLLDDNGKAKDHFLTWDYIRESHPRTAIGYYEPGHYCILLVDGRQEASRGMFLDEMAAVFEDLGCKQAYNLDGGHCSFMTLESQIVNHPYKPEHQVEDAIMLMEGVQ